MFPQEKAFFDKFLETSRSAHSFFVFVLRNTHPSLRKFPTFSSNTHPFSNPGFLSARHPCTVVVACTRGALRRYPPTPFLRRRPHVHVPSAPARNLDQKNIFHSNNFLPPTHQQQCKQHTKLNTHRRHCTAAFSRHSAHSTPLPPSTGVPHSQENEGPAPSSQGRLCGCRGTSLIRNRHPAGLYTKTMPRLLWQS